jgi:alkaline phosphatase D
MFGQKQLQWLKDSLLNSIATFKVIVAGGQVMNPIAAFEGLGTLPHEQRAVTDMIVQNRIEGVLFLTGDRHFSELIRVTPQGGYPLYDFTCSPLSSGTRPVAEDDPEFKNPARVAGTLFSGQRNYGAARLSGNGATRTLSLECHDKTGKVVGEHKITRSELAFPR